MGILNITPDSFSDGGKYFQIEDAIKHAKELIKNGVDIIDIGGESTRPNAKPISEEEELKRVIPIIRKLSAAKFLISIDTYKSKVAQAALNAGANIINDISGLTIDSNMVKVAAKYSCPIVIMHNMGIPATKSEVTSLNIIKEVYNWLLKRTNYAIKNGVKKENIIIDPGVGFGKTAKEDLELIQSLKEFKPLGFPILIGPSRKSFIKKIFGEVDLEVKSREMIQLAIKNGAAIVRVHEFMLSYSSY